MKEGLRIAPFRSGVANCSDAVGDISCGGTRIWWRGKGGAESGKSTRGVGIWQRGKTCGAAARDGLFWVEQHQFPDAPVVGRLGIF